MSPKEIQKRNVKAENLRVLQSEDGQFFVESEKGRVLYRVLLDNDGNTCTCGDYSTGIRRDKDHQCKHILAVFNAIPTKAVEDAQFCEKPVPKLDERWITTIENKEFVRFPGLLDLGHQKGISSIEVDIVQMPTKDNGNFAVCRATVMSKIGETFIDVGDASPSNTSSKVAKHLLRMASTRAIARALRTYTNVGMTALEELADFNDAISESGQPKQRKSKPKTAKKPVAKEPKKATAKAKSTVKDAQEPKASDKEEPQTSPGSQDKSAQPKMSEAQKRALYNLSRRRGISVEELEKMALDAYGCELENLTTSDASAFIRQLQQAA